jgi:hypothetical protein
LFDRFRLSAGSLRLDDSSQNRFGLFQKNSGEPIGRPITLFVSKLTSKKSSKRAIPRDAP